MNILYKTMGGGAVLAGLFAYGAHAEQKVYEDYNISLQSEIKFMSRCTQAMSINDVSFTHGASDNKGCACLTKSLMSQVEASEVPAVETYTAFLVEAGGLSARDELNPIQFMKDMGNINKRHKLTDSQSDKYMDLVGGAMGNCGESDYHTPDNVAYLASMHPKGGQIKLVNTSARPRPQLKIKPPELRGSSKG